MRSQATTAIRLGTAAIVLAFGCSDTGPSLEQDTDSTHDVGLPDAATKPHDDPPPAHTTPNDTNPPSDDEPASGELVSKFMADAGDGWLTLIDAKWTLAAGQEAHLTAHLNVTQEAYLHEFSPVKPLGTHHSVLNVLDAQDASGPEGVFAGTNTSGRQIYGSGVGTERTELPDGVAMHVLPGQQLVLDLHLFNATEHELTGTSGVLAKTVPKAEVMHEAEGILAGPLSLTVPIGKSVQTGQCTISADSTIFNVGPHMHQLGVHLKATAHRAVGGDAVLYDGPYAFESQLRYPVDDVQVKSGDTIAIECTYQNDTDHVVSWGQSSLDEMCFIGVSRYPVQVGGSYLCTN